MVQTQIILFSLIIAGILIIAGFFFKGKALYLSYSGSVIIVITGIVLLGSPLTFPTGTNITFINETFIQTQLNYTPQNSLLTQANSAVIMLLGFIGIIGSTLSLTKEKEKSPDME